MKRLLPAGGVLIFLALLLFFFGLKKAPQESLPSMKESADISLSQVSFVQSENGVKKWELRAEKAQLFEKEQTVQLGHISVVMKTQKGIPLTISGERGEMDMEGKTISIQQEKVPVSIAWGNGYTIKTSALRWASAENVIESDDHVTIAGSGISINGERLKIFLDRSELTILGGVHAKGY